MPISRSAAGTAVLKATLNGKPVTVGLDMENRFTIVSRASTAAWNVPVRRGEVSRNKLGTDSLTDIATLGDLAIGGAKLDRLEAFVDDRDLGGADLIIGTNMLKNFLPEFDVGHNVLRLFAKQHCPDKVVYWAPDYLKLTYEEISDRFLVAGTINDKPAEIAISPGLARSVVASETVAAIPLGRQDDGHAVLSTLEFGGVRLHNIPADIGTLVAGSEYGIPGQTGSHLSTRRVMKATDLKLGDDVLKHLRFIIDFDAKTIYFTVG